MPSRRAFVEEETRSDMTPMIDVTFLLLIFFLVTLKFKTLERKLSSHLPTTFGTGSHEPIIDESFATVRLRQPSAAEAGADWRSPERTRFYLDGELVPGTPTEALREIARRLDAFRQRVPEALGKIDADVGVPHLNVVAVLDVFARTRYRTVTFVGLAGDFEVARSDVWWQKVRARLAGGAEEVAGD